MKLVSNIVKLMFNIPSWLAFLIEHLMNKSIKGIVSSWLSLLRLMAQQTLVAVCCTLPVQPTTSSAVTEFSIATLKIQREKHFQSQFLFYYVVVKVCSSCVEIGDYIRRKVPAVFKHCTLPNPKETS